MVFSGFLGLFLIVPSTDFSLGQTFAIPDSYMLICAKLFASENVNRKSVYVRPTITLVVQLILGKTCKNIYNVL